MVVEIGPRQSGKTNRLIESTVQYLEENPNKTALIVSSNNHCRRHIRKMVGESCGDCINRVVTSYKMLPPKEESTIKQFVDEFGDMGCDNLVIDPNAYYCSSYYIDVFGDGIWNGNEISNKAKDILQFYWDKIKGGSNLSPKKHVFKHEF